MDTDKDVYDLCIVGAGMFGSAAARYASANPSLKVCLIGPTEPNDTEKNSREIHSSHYDEGRIILNAYRSHIVQVLVRRTIEKFRELERLSGIQFYSPVGCIIAAEKCTDAYLARKEIPDVLDLSFDDIFQKRFPYLNLEAKDCAFFDDKGAGHVSPRKLIEAQLKIACLQGCYLIREVVETVSDSKDGLHSITTETGRLLKAKRVLFCTGAFTKFKNLGKVNNLKMNVFKETAAMIRINQDESKRLSAMPAMIVYKDELGEAPSLINGAYVLPPILYPDGNYYLKIGHMEYPRNSELSSFEEVKEWCINGVADPKFIKKYSNYLFKLIPGLKVEEVSAKTCVTCTNPTNLPYIDRVCPTVTVAVVGNSKGAMISDEVGRLAAHLSLTGQWDSQLNKVPFEAIMEDCEK